MKRMLTAATVLLLLTGCGTTESAADPQAAQMQSADLFAMDTYMNLKAYGSNASNALRAAEERITELERTFSVTDAESEVWAANHAGGAPVPVSPDFTAILDTARQVSAESSGALCISLYPLLQAWGFTTGSYQVPQNDDIAALLALADDSALTVSDGMLSVPDSMQIDLGALVKGYTGDAVMQVMQENDISAAIVSLGGNVQAMGTKPDGSPWNVAITNPFDPDNSFGIVQITDQAVITSGNYERYFEDDAGKRYCHILDPADGYPAENGLVSVTVIGDSGVRCDALSTALYVEGTEQAAAHWKRCSDFEMILVTDDGCVMVSEGIADRFQSDGTMPVEVMHREE